jgi:DNA-binding CsgD family transcriptional regulator
MTDKPLLDLIEGVYRAAVNPAGWGSIAPLLARAFQAESGVLQARNGRAGPASLLSVTANFDTWAIAAYGQYYYRRDEWVARGAAQGPFTVFRGEELIDEASFLRTELYADYCRKVSIFHLLGGVCEIKGEVFGAIGVHRDRKGMSFDPDDKQRLRLFLPHLQSALLVSHKIATLEVQQRASLEIMERQDIGIMIVDNDGRVLFANRLAEQELKSGNVLASSNGKVSTIETSKRSVLANLIANACHTSGGQISAAGRTLALNAPEGVLHVLAAPLPPSASPLGMAAPAALLVLSRPARREPPSEQALMERFDLTPRQARLLAALVSGQRLKDYVNEADVSLNTAKTHLKELFAKTDTHRQTDLIATVLRDPILRLHSERS